MYTTLHKHASPSSAQILCPPIPTRIIDLGLPVRAGRGPKMPIAHETRRAADQKASTAPEPHIAEAEIEPNHGFSQEGVATAAYYIWEKEDRPWGRDKEHWRIAIEQLKARTSNKPLRLSTLWEQIERFPPVPILVRFLTLGSLWLQRRPILAAELGIVLLMLLGLIGKDFGLSNLFWHEFFVPQLVAGCSVAAFALFLWFLSYAGDSEPDKLASAASTALGWGLPSRKVPSAAGASESLIRGLRTWLTALFLPLAILLTLAALAYTVAHWTSWPFYPGFWPLPLGVWLVGAITYFSIKWWESRSRLQGFAWWHGAVTIVAGVILVNLLALIGPLRESVTAVMALCLVMAELALLEFLTYQRPLVRIAIFFGLLATVAYTNSCPYKLTYPGLQYY